MLGNARVLAESLLRFDGGGVDAAGSDTARADEFRLLAVADLAVVTDPAGLERPWRALESAAVGHAFQHYDFITGWLDTVGRARDAAPLIVAARAADGALAALLPLAVTRCLGRRVIVWAGGESADYGSGLFAPDFLSRLAEGDHASIFRRAVVEALRPHADLLHLDRQPETLAGQPNPMIGARPIRNSDSSHQTELGATWDTYYRGKRNSHSRRTDRSKRRRLDILGTVRAFDATSAADIDRVMDALVDQKQRQMRRVGMGDLFARGGVTDFYREIAHRPFPHGPSHMAALEIDGRIVAANWGLVRRSRYYYVMHSYDEESAAAHYSPGRHLMYHLMQWSIDHDITTFDFTIGDETFKRQWCERTIDLYDDVEPLGPAGLDIALALKAAKPLKRFIKSQASLHGLARRLRRTAEAI